MDSKEYLRYQEFVKFYFNVASYVQELQLIYPYCNIPPLRLCLNVAHNADKTWKPQLLDQTVNAYTHMSMDWNEINLYPGGTVEQDRAEFLESMAKSIKRHSPLMKLRGERPTPYNQNYEVPPYEKGTSYKAYLKG